MCHYRVNCPECDVDGDLDIDWPDDKCTTCLIDGVFNTVFRIVSLGNGSGDKDSFNANDRPLGYNWNYKFANSGTNYGFVGGKADATLDLIYSLGDGIYGEKPILSITLTPSMASDIRDYNKNKSYANDTLTCYDHEESGYQNIFCYSELLNDWVEIYGDNIEFDGRTGKINKDLVENFNGSYKGNAYWTIYTTNISTGYGIVGGPSWK